MTAPQAKVLRGGQVTSIPASGIDAGDILTLEAGDLVAADELVRAIRFSVAAEYEAVQLYMQLAASTDNTLAVKVLKDIADEERVHAGEFLRLPRELAPDESKYYAQGSEELEEEIKKKR